jgi:hypothetical protein
MSRFSESGVELLAAGSHPWLANDSPTDPGGKRTMSAIEESVDVEVPVSTAYNQWT